MKSNIGMNMEKFIEPMRWLRYLLAPIILNVVYLINANGNEDKSQENNYNSDLNYYCREKIFKKVIKN